MNIEDESVTTLDDLKGDLALRYKWTPSSGTSVDREIVEADMVTLDRDGYVIWGTCSVPRSAGRSVMLWAPGCRIPDATPSRGGALSASTA